MLKWSGCTFFGVVKFKWYHCSYYNVGALNSDLACGRDSHVYVRKVRESTFLEPSVIG